MLPVCLSISGDKIPESSPIATGSLGACAPRNSQNFFPLSVLKCPKPLPACGFNGSTGDSPVSVGRPADRNANAQTVYLRALRPLLSCRRRGPQFSKRTSFPGHLIVAGWEPNESQIFGLLWRHREAPKK